MPNKIYSVLETAIVFASSPALTLASLGSGAGRISARHDRGDAAHAALYEWRMKMELATTGVLSEVVRLYAATSDGTVEDGDLGTTDAAVSAEDLLRNLHYFGLLEIDVADTGPFHASGWLWVPSRYISVVVWNATADAFHATEGNSEVTLTPVPHEIQ